MMCMHEKCRVDAQYVPDQLCADRDDPHFVSPVLMLLDMCTRHAEHSVNVVAYLGDRLDVSSQDRFGGRK